MKDIENSMAQSAAALARLERALARLDTLAAKPRLGGGPMPAPGALEGEVARLKREHAAMKDAAGRVATRLDETIARLAASLRESA